MKSGGAKFLDFNIIKAKRILPNKINIQGQIISVDNIEFDEAVLLLRPDMIILTKQKTELENCLPCLVVDYSFNGHVYSVYLDCGFRLKVSLTKYYFDELDVKVGNSVFASFSKTAVSFLKSN